MARTIVGIFPDRDQANRCSKELIHQGLAGEEIQVIESEGKEQDTRNPYPGAGRISTQAGKWSTLIDAGVSPEDAKAYMDAVRRGDVLLLVIAEDKMGDRVAETINRFRSSELPESAEVQTEPRWDGFSEPSEWFAFEDAVKPDQEALRALDTHKARHASDV